MRMFVFQYDGCRPIYVSCVSIVLMRGSSQEGTAINEATQK